MLPRHRMIAFLSAAVIAVAAWGPAHAQRFGRFGGQNEPPKDSEFIFARWQYSSGSGGWSHDYPDAEEHINAIMKEVTGIAVEHSSYRIVPMRSSEIFDYPFGYISEPGTMWLTDQEVSNFREFVNRGGFVMLDDFDGPRQFEVMKENLQRVFPDRQMVRLDNSHNVLHTFYDINSIYVESPYEVGAPAIFYGINNDRGELSVIICFNNDIGDFWEWIDQPQYALKPSAEALRLGINFVLYSFTH